MRSEFDSELDKGLMKKVNELVSLNEELRNSICTACVIQIAKT